MDELMFADGVYPDFSLLKEVLLPPYFESDPCSTRGDVQSEEIILLAQSQYREQPPDAAVGLNDSGISVRSKDSSPQYCRRTRRGGKKRSIKNRSSSVPRNHTKKSQKFGHKMSCVTEIPEPSIIYLLEESMNNLPKRDNNFEDDQVNSCSKNGEHVRTDSVRNGRRMTPCSSSMTSDAMELLNLINMQCSHLNKLGGDPLRIEEIDHKQRNGDGHPKMVKSKISNSDDLSSTSSNKPHKVQGSERGSPVIHGGLVSGDCNLSTSGEVSSVEREEDQSGECSLLNTSTGSEVCVRKTPRKQQTPMKGVEKQDPAFQGIEFQMHLCFEKEKCDDCQLIMTSFYSRTRSRRKSTKSRLRFKSTSLSSGSEDDHMPPPSSRSKQCASCKTQKTPLWRDAEDGTPLCNACGIRYKKYGLRCGQCWNIPKKDGKSCSKYCGCGGMFRAPV
ncbi:GATA-type zinc finger protein 1 [Hyla sarda]|uniref:GATA-type zinc finger protein 1 n=1 Tax=Hyla sarda TaxID=327740 RepID=UPI0024C38390|nr:GATA-type zinc finger protein 1 [Hyla sarda]